MLPASSGRRVCLPGLPKSQPPDTSARALLQKSLARARAPPSLPADGNGNDVSEQPPRHQGQLPRGCSGHAPDIPY